MPLGKGWGITFRQNKDKQEIMTSPTFWQDSDIQYLLREFDALGDEGYANYRRSQTNPQGYTDRRPNAIEEWMRNCHPLNTPSIWSMGFLCADAEPTNSRLFWNLVNGNQSYSSFLESEKGGLRF